MIQELEKTLSVNIDLYDEMKQELEAERDALKRRSMADLERVVSRKSALALRIKMLDESRLRTIEALADRMKASASELTLSVLSDRLGGAMKARLLALRERLRASVESVTAMNEFNRGLIEKSMVINYQAASRLQQLVQPEPTYEKKGAPGARLGSGGVVNEKT